MQEIISMRGIFALFKCIGKCKEIISLKEHKTNHKKDKTMHLKLFARQEDPFGSITLSLNKELETSLQEESWKQDPT